jgi:hypothetical protein
LQLKLQKASPAKKQADQTQNSVLSNTHFPTLGLNWKTKQLLSLGVQSLSYSYCSWLLCISLGKVSPSKEWPNEKSLGVKKHRTRKIYTIKQIKTQISFVQNQLAKHTTPKGKITYLLIS